MRNQKTIRKFNQWVKITRDQNKRFTFALGWEGEVQAHDITSYSAEWMPTWKDAIAHAERKTEDYK